MKPGYAFALDESVQDALPGWNRSPSDSWAIEVYTPDGREIPMGYRSIDGSEVQVFYCPTDKTYRAQTLVFLRPTPSPSKDTPPS